MAIMVGRISHGVAVSVLAVAGFGPSAGAASGPEPPQAVRYFLEDHCLDCHDAAASA